MWVGHGDRALQPIPRRVWNYSPHRHLLPPPPLLDVLIRFADLLFVEAVNCSEEQVPIDSFFCRSPPFSSPPCPILIWAKMWCPRPGPLILVAESSADPVANRTLPHSGDVNRCNLNRDILIESLIQTMSSYRLTWNALVEIRH